MTKASAVASFWIGVAAMIASVANAHGGDRHDGSAITGTVHSISKESLELETALGEVGIVLSEETRFVEDDAPIARTALKVGMRVSIHGSKLPGGGIAARDVTLDLSKPTGESGDRHTGQDQR